MYYDPKVGDLVELIYPDLERMFIIVLEWTEFYTKFKNSKETIYSHCMFEVKGFNSYTGNFVVYYNDELTLVTRNE